MKCTQTDTQKKLSQFAGEQIDRLTDLSSEGIEVTSNGTVVSEKIKELSATKKTLDQGRLPEDLGEKLGVENSLFEMSMRRNLGGKFKGRKIRAGEKDRFGTFVLQGVYAEGNDVTLTVKELVNKRLVNEKEYKFKRGFNTSVVDEEQLYIGGMGTAMDKAYSDYNNTRQGLGQTAKSERVEELVDDISKAIYGQKLGSSASTGFNKKGFKEYKGYVHGDTDHMKNMVDELNSIGKKADPEMMNVYKDLFDSMHPSFFRNMSMYVNESARDTAGWVELGQQDIYVGVQKHKRTGQTAAEVYAHEVVHTMTAWALGKKDSFKARKANREINRLIKLTLGNTSWRDFLGNPEDKASKAEIERAKELYDYVFLGDTAEHEFIAYALTNPMMKKHLESIPTKDHYADTVWGKIVDVFMRLMDAVLGSYSFTKDNSNVHDQVHSLAFQLATVNQRAEETNVLARMGNALYDALSDMDGKVGEFLTGVQEKVFKKKDKLKAPDKDAGKTAQLVYMAKLLFKAISVPEYRKAAGLYATEVLRLNPEGSVREFIRFFFTPDDMARSVEWLGLKNNNIDMMRESYVNSSRNQILEKFNKELTEEEEGSLTRVLLDTNATNLLYSNKKAPNKKTYSNKELRDVLEDDVELGKKLATAKNKLGKINSERYNFLVNQAVGLGYFMATHKGNAAQLTNATAIARGVLTNERHKVDAELVESINEIASLTAIKYTSKDRRKTTADLMRDEYEGVRNVADMYEDFKKNSVTRLFDGDDVHMMDGYTKEVFDDGIDMQIRPLKDRETMEKMGYKFQGKLKAKKDIRSETELGLFVSDSYAKAERLQQAVTLGDLQARGTSMKEVAYLENPDTARTAFQRNKTMMDLKRKEITNAMEAGELDVTKLEMGVMPILDAEGQVTDYRNMMSKDRKENLLKQDVRISEVLPRSISSIVNKELRETHNLDVLELIKEDMKKNWEKGKIGKDNLTEYRLIGPDVNDPQMQELYYMLPNSYKRFIKSRNDKTMAVRSDLMNMYFGYKHIQLGDVKGIRMLPNVIRKVINMFESFWMDLIKIAKTNILMKMPMILISNIVSNMLYAVNTGTSPFEIGKMYMDSVADVKAFMKNHKRSIELDTEIGSMRNSIQRGMRPEKKGRLIHEIEKKENELKRVRREMDRSDVKELFDLGMYQAIIEDVNTNTIDENNKITGGMDKLLHKTPVYVRTPLQWLYLSKETKWYKFNQEVLQLSDLVARDVMNKKGKQMANRQADGEKDLPRDYREEKGIRSKKKKLVGKEREEFLQWSQKVRRENLLDAFINYSRPNGSFEEYMNRIGLFMFTKYVKGIQRVIFKAGGEYPLKTALTLVGASMMLDIDNIQDQSFLTKGFDYQGDFGVTNIFPVYDPFEQVQNVITPALLKEEPYLGLV